MDLQPLTIITKRSILDVAAVLDPPLDIPDFELPSVITGEERRPDIIIRYKNKLYMNLRLVLKQEFR